MITAEKNITIDPSIFRAYDIRGVIDKTFTEKTVYFIGKALGSLALEKGEVRMTLGRDGRLSGPRLSAALRDGILSTGCDVIDVGMLPTPLLYYTTFVLYTRSGVMLTGSHNPPEYNGLKMMINGETLAEEKIQQLYQRILRNDFFHGEGECRELDVIPRYITHVSRDAKLTRPLKIVIDCGNGIAGSVAPALYREMGCEVHELFCEVDGRFPNHHPDPSQVENLQDLIHAVKKQKADVGIAFDGDGDRLGIVTNQGKIIWPDRQLMLFAQSILKEKPGAMIIYDVKCTNHLGLMITKWGGRPLLWKTGHSLIKAKLAETQAALAGEMSGHIFFKDRWYGMDDALYAGARLLQILSYEKEDCDTIFNLIPDSVNTPELKIAISEEDKFPFMQQLIDTMDFQDADIVTIDGLRVSFSDGWGLVRPSNTTPCLVLRFEAQDEKGLARIQKLFRAQLLSVKSDLVVPF